MGRQDIFLEFDNPLSQFFAGLQWEANPQAGGGVFHLFAHHHDLDISCVLLDKDRSVVDVITPMAPKTNQYRLQVLHTGDHQTGNSDLEDEEIRINLKTLDSGIHHVLFAVSNKGKAGFEDVDAPFCHFMDSSTFRRFFSVDLRQHPVPRDVYGDHVYFCAAMLNRLPLNRIEGDDWSLTPLLKYVTGNQEGPHEMDVTSLVNSL